MIIFFQRGHSSSENKLCHIWASTYSSDSSAVSSPTPSDTRSSDTRQSVGVFFFMCEPPDAGVGGESPARFDMVEMMS